MRIDKLKGEIKKCQEKYGYKYCNSGCIKFFNCGLLEEFLSKS